MPGVKGQVHKVHRRGSKRRQAWQSMRIKRRFTVPEIVITVPGGGYSNFRKWTRLLVIHGYLQPFGESGNGYAGRYQAYRLVRGQGFPDPPTVCDRCEKAITARACEPKVDENE